MKRTILLVILCLCCATLTSDAEGSHKCWFGEPDPSAEHDRVFNWTLENVILWRFGYAMFLSGRKEWKLTSPTVCSTGGQLHSLVFWYKLYSNNTINVSVSIKYNDANNCMTWVLSGGDGWNTANIPINTTEDFKIILRAKRRPGNLTSVDSAFISIIRYFDSGWLSGRFPPNASETMCTTQANIPITSVVPKVSTNRATTTSRAIPQSPTETGTSPPNTITPTSPTQTPQLSASTTTTTTETTTEAVTTSKSTYLGSFDDMVLNTKTPENIQDAYAQPSNKVVIILGVIVAVLIVVIIVMAVLLVVFRRKNVQRNKQHRDSFQMNPTHNAAYNRDADELPYANSAQLNHTRQNADNHRPQNRNPSSANYNSDNQPQPYNSAEPVYTEANTLRNERKGNPPQSQRNADKTIYEVCNQNEMCSSRGPGTDNKNNPSEASQQGQDEHNTVSTFKPTACGDYMLAGPQEENRVYHILEKDPETKSDTVDHVPVEYATTAKQAQDGEYNRLDFCKTSGVDGKRCEAEKSEGTADTVYSHLNEVGEDTYNEVHRKKRVEVIDGVYSHIK